MTSTQSDIRSSTYRPSILQKASNELDNPAYILIPLNEPNPLTPRQLADHIKGKVLQPPPKIANAPLALKQFLRLAKENRERAFYERFVGYQTGHAERAIDATAVAGVVAFGC